MTKSRVFLIAFFVLIALAAIAPIRSYDLFWHMATGRWIVEHRALPLTDPFTIASDRTPWINGSWLIEIVAYALHEVVGIDGLSIVRGIFTAALFALAYVFAQRDSKPHVALALTALAFAGANPLIDMRPSSVAMLFVVLALSLRSPLAHALLAMVWINVHPSALLAPIIAALVTRRAAPAIASAVGLLANPYGIHAITAPLTLLSFVGGGTFVNIEWLPSAPGAFPLLYVAIGAGAIAFFTAEDHRAQWWRVALFVMFAALAIRHVRHQPLFFAAFPLLVAPAVREVRAVLAHAVTGAAILFAIVTGDHGLGLLRDRFPLEAVARLQSAGLKGNVYNPDQFGGFLIWSFYPERRALTDGRNELYHAFIPEYARARGDQRAWRALLRKYRIDLAVDEYRAPLDVVDAVTRRHKTMPASLAYWPRREWALIAYDRAGMVFARRAAFSKETIEKLEIRRVVD